MRELVGVKTFMNWRFLFPRTGFMTFGFLMDGLGKLEQWLVRNLISSFLLTIVGNVRSGSYAYVLDLLPNLYRKI